MGYIYKITNKVNNKIYIGKTTLTIEERFEAHKKKALKHPNRYLYDAMNHYGFKNFIIEEIEECADELLNEREIYWIKFYNSTNHEIGYNLTKGGDGGNTWELNNHKLETGELIRKSNLKEKYYPITKEELQKDINEGLTLEEMIQKYHAAPNTLRKRIKLFFGKSLTEIRPVRNIGQFQSIKIDKDNFLKDIKECVLTNEEIMQKYHIGETTFFNKCKEFSGVTPNQIRGKSLIKQGTPKKNIDKQQLYQQIILQKDIQSIADYFSVSKNTIQRRTKEYFNKTVMEVKKDAKRK